MLGQSERPTRFLTFKDNTPCERLQNDNALSRTKTACERLEKNISSACSSEPRRANPLKHDGQAIHGLSYTTAQTRKRRCCTSLKPVASATVACNQCLYSSNHNAPARVPLSLQLQKLQFPNFFALLLVLLQVVSRFVRQHHHSCVRRP